MLALTCINPPVYFVPSVDYTEHNLILYKYSYALLVFPLISMTKYLPKATEGKRGLVWLMIQQVFLIQAESCIGTTIFHRCSHATNCLPVS